MAIISHSCCKSIRKLTRNMAPMRLLLLVLVTSKTIEIHWDVRIYMLLILLLKLCGGSVVSIFPKPSASSNVHCAKKVETSKNEKTDKLFFKRCSVHSWSWVIVTNGLFHEDDYRFYFYRFDSPERVESLYADTASLPISYCWVRWHDKVNSPKGRGA